MGSFIWVADLLKPWIALPHIRRNKHKMCLCTTSTTITDLQADRGADVHKILLLLTRASTNRVIFDLKRHSDQSSISESSSSSFSACQLHISALSVWSLLSGCRCDFYESTNHSSFSLCTSVLNQNHWRTADLYFTWLALTRSLKWSRDETMSVKPSYSSLLCGQLCRHYFLSALPHTTSWLWFLHFWWLYAKHRIYFQAFLRIFLSACPHSGKSPWLL